MIIKDKSDGVKIEHTIKSGKLTLNDEITLNLSAYERDYDVHIIISQNEYGMLMPGNGKRIVAELDIPARSYSYVEDGQDDEGAPKYKKVADAFDHEKVTFTRWPLGV